MTIINWAHIILMSKLVTTVVKVNKILFPFLAGLAFVLSGLEAYSYLGFLKKFLFVDSRFFLVIAIISALLLIGTKLNPLCIFTFRINAKIFPIVLIAYLIMQTMEVLHFRNYVFSTYHIQPTTYFYTLFFSAIIFLISRLIKQKTISPQQSIFKLIMVAVLIVIFMEGAVKTLDAATYADIYIFSHINSTYDFKMSERWGIYYDYIKFVEKNTPENASILIPPQELPWYSTGNEGLDRYFLFPRSLEGGSYDGTMDLDKYDYVMLVWGEWNNAPKEKYGWPKVKVPAEKVIYFDPETKQTLEVNGNYSPGEDSNKSVWGIIKIKK